MPTVAAILPEGFEELEAVAPIDVLRRAGIEVTIAALGNDHVVKGRNGLTLLADTTLGALEWQLFDLLFLPGGPGVKHLRASPEVIKLVKQHYEGSRYVAAICAAPTVLADAGLLTGRRYTAHFSVADELPAILSDEQVVIDGRIITSRGAGTALEFGLKLVELLRDAKTAREIAASICL